MAYSAVYSQQFIVRWGGDPLPAYEVPAGFTAVIRDFSFYSGAAGDIMRLYIQNSAAAPQVVAAMLEGTGAPEYQQWQGRVVVPAGGFISLAESVVGDEADVYVGGYLLRNVTN